MKKEEEKKRKEKKKSKMNKLNEIYLKKSVYNLTK